jgi:predicted ABC-type ATPase
MEDNIKPNRENAILGAGVKENKEIYLTTGELVERRLAEMSSFGERQKTDAYSMREEKPSALFYAGPLGAGKRVVANDEGRDRVFFFIDANAIANRMHGGVANEYNRLSASVQAGQLFERALDDKKSFSVTTSLAQPDVLNKMRAAKAAGFNVELHYVGVASAQVSEARVRDRELRGGNKLDSAMIKNTYVAGLKNLPEAVRIADSARISESVSAGKLVRYANYEGNFNQRFKESVSPAWVKDALVRIDARKNAMKTGVADGKVQKINSPDLSTPKAVAVSQKDAAKIAADLVTKTAAGITGGMAKAVNKSAKL